MNAARSGSSSHKRIELLELIDQQDQAPAAGVEHALGKIAQAVVPGARAQHVLELARRPVPTPAHGRLAARAPPPAIRAAAPPA